LLQVTVGNLAQDGDEGGIVAKGLMELPAGIKNLDPSLIDSPGPGILASCLTDQGLFCQIPESRVRRLRISLSLWTKGKQA